MSDKRPVRPDDLYLLRSVNDPQVSPDGRRVAFVVGRADHESDGDHRQVWVAPTDGREPARPFTTGGEDHSPRWSPDGRFLAFVSDRGEKNQIFLAPLDGGEPRQLTHAEHGVASPAWSPDGRRLAFVARVGPAPDREKGRVVRHLRSRLDGVGWFDERRMHIFTVEVDGGAERQMTDGDWHDEQPAWSPDGATIAFVADRELDRHDRHMRGDIWVVPASGGRARRLTRARGIAAAPAFSPDGRFVAFASHEYGSQGTARAPQLMIVPASGGAAPRSLSAPLDRGTVGLSFVPGATLRWLPDSSGVVFVVVDAGRMSLHVARLDGGTPRRLIAGERQIEVFDLASDGKRVAFVASWVDEPQEVYTATVTGRQERRVSDANGELRTTCVFGTADRMRSRAPDSVESESLVIRPPVARRGRASLALEIHGGPHGMHPSSFAWLKYQVLAGAGYTVLLPNPRGSGGYGDAFSLACVEDWGGGDFDDLMGAVDECVERYGVDPRRLYVGGYSYGGFMTAWVVGHTDRFRGALVGAPVTDHVSMFGTSDVPLFSRFEHGGTPWERPDEYAKRSPVTHLPDVRTPVLILHREGDMRCPIGQSEELFTGLRVLGKEVEMVRYPGGSHVGAAPSHRVDELERTVAWYRAH